MVKLKSLLSNSFVLIDQPHGFVPWSNGALLSGSEVQAVVSCWACLQWG